MANTNKSNRYGIRRRKKRRLLNMVRRWATIIIMVSLITGLAGYIAAQNNEAGSSEFTFRAHATEGIAYKSIIVRSGDTLWDIACVYSEPSEDVRSLIREICVLNDIKPGAIYPGQTILIPVPAHMA